MSLSEIINGIVTPYELAAAAITFCNMRDDDELEAEEIAFIQGAMLIKGYMVLRTYPEYGEKIAEWMLYLHQHEPPSPARIDA